MAGGGLGMKQQRWSGLTARMGSVLSGAFTIMSTNLSLIFERRQLQAANCTVSLQDHFTKHGLRQLVGCRSWAVACALGGVSLAASCVLLYSVHAKAFRGLLLYVGWVPLHEGASLGVQILTNHWSSPEVRALRWFGWAARTLAHCYWLFFVIMYTQIIYKSQNQGNILAYNRRISMGSSEAPRRKSKILSFIQHYKPLGKGMDARTVSFLVGTFSVLNTGQFLIFDLNQSTHIGFEDQFSIYLPPRSALANWLLTHRSPVSCVLSLATILAGCVLLYCVHLGLYAGLPAYALWIVTYELLSFSMALLLHRAVREQFRELGHLGLLLQVSRMLLHFAGLPFVVRHGYGLYRHPQATGKVGRRRRSSVSTVDSLPAGLGALYHKLS